MGTQGEKKQREGKTKGSERDHLHLHAGQVHLEGSAICFVLQELVDDVKSVLQVPMTASI